MTYPLRERKMRMTRWFLARVFMLILLVGGIAYAAWFAPWVQPVRHIAVETTR